MPPLPPVPVIEFITIAVSLLRNPKSQRVLGSTIKEAHQRPTSQIHGQSSKTPPSPGSDSNVLDDGITKEMLGLRAVLNWKIEHMSRGSKLKAKISLDGKKKKQRKTARRPQIRC